MKFILKINESESEKAAYVGWTPVKCTLTVEGYTGQSPMPVTITTGNDGNEGRLSLYTTNATTALPVHKIEHDFQNQREFTFYIAGQYPYASVAKKDTFIRVESQTNEIDPLITKVMVRVRKNANELTEEEIKIFLESFVRLNINPPKKQYDGDYTVKPNKLLHEIVLMHTLDAAYEIHSRTSFHPWHRIFNMHLERELQEIDSRVTIPYWKFDEKADQVFSQKFIGETSKTDDPNQGVAERLRPVFDAGNPLITYAEHTVWGPLRRAYRKLNPAVEKPDVIYTEDQIISGEESSEYFLYWSRFEERRSHNQAHNAFTGHVVDIGRDPVDPLFFMMHANVDRLWALWQQKHNRFDGDNVNTYPFQNKYAGERGSKWAVFETADADGIYQANNDDIGNFAEDTLWPWDWDGVLSRPMRKWTSKDQNYGIGVVPQINIDFPGSVTSNYPDGPVTVKSTIDYQGRQNNQTILGFDYDRIPYFDHDKKITDTITMSNPENDNPFFQNNGDISEAALNTLRNRNADLTSRLRAIGFIDETSEIFLDIALLIIENVYQPIELRSELIHSVFTAKRANRFYPSRKPYFFNILRGLLTDENQKLRFQAIDILASSEDEFVQEFLINELRKEESEFISKPDAIFFLRQNTKPQHAELFRELFKNSDNPDVKKAAIEGLGDDPESIGLLKEVVQDTNESFKIREAGALSLHHLDHQLMNELAERIITHPESDEGITLFKKLAPDPDEVDFKAGLLNMLTFTGDINSLKQNEGLKVSLKEVTDPGLGNKAKKFLSTFETSKNKSVSGPTIIEQMAAKLLNRLEGNEES